MMHILKALRRCTGGASVVELGLVAPFFAALVIGMSDLASAYSMKLRLEQAAQRSLEMVQQMSAPADPANKATIEADAAASATAAGYTGATVAVTYTNYCNGVATTNYTDACTNTTDTQMKYVNVTITSKYTPLFSHSYFPNHNADGTVTTSGNAGMRVQ